MATANAISGTNLPDFEGWDGTINLEDSTLVVIGGIERGGGRIGDDGGNNTGTRTELLGSFSGSGDNVTGTITGLRHYRDDLLVYSADQLSANAADVINAIDQENYEGAAALLFAQSDTITGSGGNDVIRGYAGDDVITAGSGDDVIRGMTGRDTIDGGPGSDTAQFAGDQRFYTVGIGGDEEGFRVFDNDFLYDFPPLDDSDLINDIEFLQFDDATFDLNQFTGLLTVSAGDMESFIELYIAYFNRAPDALGLGFWGTAFANGTTLEQMAALFIDQEETRQQYPINTRDEVFITTVFTNVLGRPPDSDGNAFWTGVLASGAVSRDQFILEVLRGARADLRLDLGQEFVDQQLADRAFLENKVLIGALFSLELGLSNVANARTAMSIFDGSAESFSVAVNATRDFLFEAPESEFRLVINGQLETTRQPVFVQPDVVVVPGQSSNKVLPPESEGEIDGPTIVAGLESLLLELPAVVEPLDTGPEYDAPELVGVAGNHAHLFVADI